MRPWLSPEPANWWNVVDDAIQEDVGFGDVTASCIDAEHTSEWYIEAQADGILCGMGIVDHVLSAQGNDPEEAALTILLADGSAVKRGDRVAQGLQSTHRVLAMERTALNFVMHLSGVATLTHQFVGRTEGTRAKVVDTRKTLPGLRALQKYAVRCGGGHNHRMGLFDGAMIKDNHIRAAGGIADAVRRVRAVASHMIRIEVECESLEQVSEAVAAGADIVMLDNMDPFMMREAVKQHAGACIFEASGGISLDTVKGVAQTGVDYISVGALTHSAPALSFHLELS